MNRLYKLRVILLIGMMVGSFGIPLEAAGGKKSIIERLKNYFASFYVSQKAESSVAQKVSASTSSRKYVSFKAEEAFLKNKYDNICGLRGTKLCFNFKHIFEGDKLKNGSFSGFHHDYLGYVRKNGLKKMKRTKKVKYGFYEALVLDDNGRQYRKTFFPESWSRDKVMQTLVKAINNAKFVFTQGNRIILESKLSDKIKIKLMVDLYSAKVVSAYPTW